MKSLPEKSITEKLRACASIEACMNTASEIKRSSTGYSVADQGLISAKVGEYVAARLQSVDDLELHTKLTNKSIEYAKDIDGYEHRPEQVAAAAILYCKAARRGYLQAGPGTGKSKMIILMITLYLLANKKDKPFVVVV